jgi:hypothetical protein
VGGERSAGQRLRGRIAIDVILVTVRIDDVSDRHCCASARSTKTSGEYDGSISTA